MFSRLPSSFVTTEKSYLAVILAMRSILPVTSSEVAVNLIAYSPGSGYNQNGAMAITPIVSVRGAGST